VADMTNREKIKNYVAIASAIFFVAFLNGYLEAVNHPERSRIIVDSFFENLDFTKNFNRFMIFGFIFLNNALKSFLIILFGFFFAVVPLIFIYANGELIGLVVGVFQQEESLLLIVLGLLPHGILEIPAMILSTSYGIWLGNCFYRRLKYKEAFQSNFSFAMMKFIKIILPLIFLAATIESFVTPAVIDYLFSR